jgi:1-deoxy-D-xylulose-5-phosphate reductoisomerase
MHLPIELALTKFKNKSEYVKPFIKAKHVLESINQEKYKPIKWAYKCLDDTKSPLPIIINAAND